MPDWIAAVLLGIIEGLTEFLPVSSTGHLILAERLLPIRSEFLKSELFTVVIQPGAVAAVLAVFWGRLWRLVATWREKESREYLGKVLLAFFVTGVGGLTIKKLGFTLPETVTPVALSTLVGGVLFLVVEAWLEGRTSTTQVTWAMAAALGAAQILAAVFPGLSRSGSTILVALILGLARREAAEFSFLLGVPTLLAAAAKEGYDHYRHPPGFAVDWTLVALGALVAAVTAFLSVRWLLSFVQSHTFRGFGYYRIALGGAILLMIIA